MNEENTQNIEKKEKKSKNLLMAIIIVIIIVILGFILLKPTGEVNAPGDSEGIGQDELATTTDEMSDESNADTSIDLNGGTQIIKGNGFEAKVTPIKNQGPTGPTPIVREFTFKKTSSGSCIFNWRVDDAKECSFVNPVNKTGTRDVGSEGNIQIVSGSYRVECIGDGGIITVSETLVCQ